MKISINEVTPQELMQLLKLFQGDEIEVAAPVAPAPAAPAAPVAPAAPAAPAPAAPVAPAPAAPAAPAAPVVPVASEKNYTIEDIANATIAWVRDKPGSEMVIQELNRSFGIVSIKALQPHQIGAYAQALRGLGATI